MKLKLLIFLSSLLLIFTFTDTNFACSCAGSATVLEEFESSESVIVAKAVSVEMKEEAAGVDFEAQIKKAGYDNTYYYVNSTKMKVEKVYKGNVKVGDELVFGQGGGADCIWTFGIKSVGESFLFYLGEPTTNHPAISEIKMSDKPAYFPITCGRSQSIVGYETDDLKYLNNLDKVKGKTRISGDLNCWSKSCPNFANVTVKIIGEKKTYETKTDEHGVYEIYDLPAGSYKVKPEIQKGWKISQSMLSYSPAFYRNESIFYGDELDLSKGVPLVLQAGRHNGINFFFEIDTAVRGKVLSPDGKPLKDVCVNAVSAELKEGDYRGRFGCTNEEGKFLIAEIPPGKYILVANNDGKITEKEPFETLFYPNTTNYAQAKSFEIKSGEHLDNFIIKVPKIEKLVTVSGRLTFNNNVPVADKRVKLKIDQSPENIDGEQYVSTDDNGNFSFKILQGFKGKLFVEMYVYEGVFRDCPQFFTEIKKALGEKTSGDIKTNEIMVDAARDVSDVIFEFNGSGCRKKN